jgi:hypothetical protein
LVLDDDRTQFAPMPPRSLTLARSAPQTTHDRDDRPDDAITLDPRSDAGETRVGRLQEPPGWFDAKTLYGLLAVDEREHRIPALRLSFGIDDDEVALQDVRIAHALAADSNGECAIAKAPRQLKRALSILRLVEWMAGGRGPEERHVARLADYSRSVRQLRSGLVKNEAGFREGLQLELGSSGGAEPAVLHHLANARRRPRLADDIVEERQHLALAFRE